MQVIVSLEVLIMTDRQLDIIQEAREFVKTELQPRVKQFEKDEGVALDFIKLMAAKGYLAAPFPKEYGGLELDAEHYGMLTEVFGKVCPASRSLLTVQTSLVGQTILRVGNNAQKQKWLPLLGTAQKIASFALTEPDIGSDAKNIQTSWVEADGNYVINGTKKWITYAGIADVFLIVAMNDGQSTVFIVEKSAPGVTVKPIKGTLAGRETYLAQIHLQNVEVPAENILGRLNFGFEYVVSAALDYGRYSIAWAGLAIAQAALDAMVRYSRKRMQFGKKLSKFQLIRAMIADATTKIHAARALCLSAASMRQNNHRDAVMQTNMAKYYSSKVAVDVVNDALQVHGANGFSNEFAVEKLYREAKVLEIIEGSSQMQQEMISSFSLKRYFINK